MNEKDILDKLSEDFNREVDHVLSNLERKGQNSYERIDTQNRKFNIPKKASITAVIIGFGGTLLFATVFPMGVLLCLGIMCLILGIGIVADSGFSFRRDAMAAIVLVFGLYMTVLSLYAIIPALPKSDAFSRIGAGIGSILVGGCILLFGAISAHYQKKTCTHPVYATCVYVREKMSSSGKGQIRRVYAPIFEFVYDGTTYNVSENWGNVGVPSVGDTFVLHINPQEPTEFYRDEKKSKKFVFIVCAALIAAGLFAIFFV